MTWLHMQNYGYNRGKISVCLSVCLAVGASGCLSVCLAVGASGCRSVRLSHAGILSKRLNQGRVFAMAKVFLPGQWKKTDINRQKLAKCLTSKTAQNTLV